MLLVALAAVTAASILATGVTIALAHSLHVGGDTRPGVQRFHSHWVPRIGGVPALTVLVGWIAYIHWSQAFGALESAITWAICLAPAFVGGLVEDLTGRAGIYARMWLAMLGAALAWWLLDARLLRFGVDSFDELLVATPALSLLFTVLMAAGAAHAVNIIDGYNGLAGSYLGAVLSAIAFVAFRVGDQGTGWIAAGGVATLVGFLVWNFPFGKIFLGDAGAYAMGLFVAILFLRVVNNNPDVSTMFPALLICYPAWETLFSVYRKRRRGMSPGKPDGLHFHMLVHKRLVRSLGAGEGEKVLRNSATSLYLSILAIGIPILAAAFWDNTLMLLFVFVSCVALYQYSYARLARFKAPTLLVSK